MAKPATIQIKLVSTADTGFYYVTKKNPRTKPEKLEFKKYDPKARKHVIFKEAKIKLGVIDADVDNHQEYQKGIKSLKRQYNKETRNYIYYI